MGFSRIRLAYTAGEAIGPDIFDFYRALGINLKQLYGSTEASVFIAVQPDGEILPDTVGVPAPGVEIQVTDGRRGAVPRTGHLPGVLQEPGRHRCPPRPADGWVHTGDAGFFNDKGHLIIIDRAKDVGRLEDGAMFAPKFIENKLKFFPEIREAVAFGDGRAYVTAFINDRPGGGRQLGRAQRRAYGSYQELAAHPQIRSTIIDQGHMWSRSTGISPQDPNLSSSQIKRFV